jgi:hypothetical protein
MSQLKYFTAATGSPFTPSVVSGTTITVSSTTNLLASMSVENTTAGINTTISSITNSTQFVVASATGITTSTALNIGTWVTATVGAQGVQGSQGAQGAQGTAGSNGAQGQSGFQFSNINTQTSNYTTVLGDATQLIVVNSSSAVGLSIPTHANVAYSTGTQLNIINIGTGVVTIFAVTPGTTTVASTGAISASPKLRTQYSQATAIQTSNDTWYVVGDII